MKTRLFGQITPTAKASKSMQELLIDSEERKINNADKMDKHQKTKERDTEKRRGLERESNKAAKVD